MHSPAIRSGVWLALLLACPLFMVSPAAHAEDAAAGDAPAEVSAEAAAETPSATGGRETRKTPAMRQVVYKALSRVRELADANKAQEANATLSRLLQQNDLNSYERAMALDLKGYLAYKADDANGAIDAYKKIVDLPDLPLSLELNSLYSLAKLALMQSRYAEAEKALNRWFQLNENPSGEAYILRAQLLYQAEKYAQAEPAVERALAFARSTMSVIPESWLLLARAVYFYQKRQQKLAAIYDQLLQHYPKPEYWVQAASVYGDLGNEARQLALLETAYDRKALGKENEVVMLAQLLAVRGNPYKGATILENEIKAGVVKDTAEQQRRLADAWYLAREYERAIQSMTKAVAADKQGELHYRLAQMYFDADQFEKAAASARVAIKRGEKSTRYDRQVLLGISLYNLERLGEAKDAFVEAGRAYDPEAKKGQNIAPQWVQHLEREIQRQKALKESLQ